MIKDKISAFFCNENASLAPFVSFTEKQAFPEYSEERGEGILTCKYNCDDFSDSLYFTEIPSGFTVKRVFRNNSDKVLRLVELGVRFEGIDFGFAPSDDYYYHVENPRVFQRMTMRVDFDRTGSNSPESEFDEIAGNKWADPGVIIDRIGACPYQPFPAILISNYNTNKGYVHGSLSQNVFYHSYLLKHNENGIICDVYSPFKDVAYREVSPAESLVDEWYIGKTERADDVEVVFAEYSHELRKKLPSNYGATSINRDNLVWGSWNDGIFRDISEDMLLAEARALKENFPTVRWLQLDDGYCTLKGKGAHGLGVPYEGEEGVDKEKFPYGIRHFTDKLRLIGLRPAVWIGGYCPKASKISTERPDLMTLYASRENRNMVLDVSIPETREYMEKALDVMIYDWGFDGVKHDFWSYAFEVSEDLLKNKDRSGYEHRHWWLDAVRKRLPGDGYFQTGCDIVMGNPFLGTHFTNYRYGIDIGAGKWENLKTNYLWCIACLATHTGDLFVPNSDAVGMFPGLSDTDAEFCVNFILITRTMVELAGRFTIADKDDRRFKMLKKATCHINNGQDVYFADYDYRCGDSPIPYKFYIKTPHFSNDTEDCLPCRTLALFNPEEENMLLSLTPASLGLDGEADYRLTDVWSGESYLLGEKIELELVPHGSRLFSVNRDEGYQVYDSCIELSRINLSGKTLSAEMSYSAEAEIRLSHKPRIVKIDGEEIKFGFKNEKLTFESRKGELELIF